ncbi:hypothetical protein RRG08_037837 [Elysia crispata]|uniref:Uncharacterized protein n=1 Tax=Elysia crispata TaxID=231223 RepID=A0AAE1AY59_9GAST|nr:hypothetical protein RRG08_037837 [Elysia crispata]
MVVIDSFFCIYEKISWCSSIEAHTINGWIYVWYLLTQGYLCYRLLYIREGLMVLFYEAHSVTWAVCPFLLKVFTVSSCPYLQADPQRTVLFSELPLTIRWLHHYHSRSCYRLVLYEKIMVFAVILPYYGTYHQIIHRLPPSAFMNIFIYEKILRQMLWSMIKQSKDQDHFVNYITIETWPATRDVYVSVLSDTKAGVYTQDQSQGWHRSLTWTHITRYKHVSSFD